MTSLRSRSASSSGRAAGTDEPEDYAAARERFSWTAAAQALSGLPDGGGLNIAHEAVDRHARGPLGSKVALRFVGREAPVDVTFASLASTRTTGSASPSTRGRPI